MEIIKSRPIDLIEILYLLKICTSDIISMEIKPGYVSVADYIDQKLQTSYIFRDNNRTVALIVINEKESAEYTSVNWNIQSERPLSIDLLIVHPNWYERGIGDKMILFAEDYARNNNFTSIRLDSFGENMFHTDLFQKFNFKQTGSYNTSLQKVPFYCYEKLL